MVSSINLLAVMNALPNAGPQLHDTSVLSSSARAYLDRANTQPPTDTSRDPAVVVDLSDDGLRARDAMHASFALREQELKNARDPTWSGFELNEMLVGDGAERRRDDVRLKAFLRFFEAQKAHLASRQAAYDRLLPLKPVPPQELTGKAKDAAYELLANRGYARPREGWTIAFSPDDRMIYHFKGDGTVWTNDGNIPTSEPAKQHSLRNLDHLIRYSQQDVSYLSSLSGDALRTKIDELFKQFGPPN